MTALSRRERHKDGEHGHDERWLITYADMITLLLAVFIVLYSFSVVDLRKFESVAGALGDVFHGSGGSGVIGGGEGILPGGAGLGINRAALISDIRGAMDQSLSDHLKGCITITHRDGVVTISMRADAITFPAARAELTAEARQMLEAVGPSLAESQSPLLIEGHTCDLPISTARFPSNWELSAQRAGNVMAYLIRTCGIDPDRVSSVGYADTKAVAPNALEENRAKNRRVDIVVLSDPTAGHGTDHAVRQVNGDSADGLRLRPVIIRPTVDLRARHYQSTGRRSVDTPSGD